MEILHIIFNNFGFWINLLIPIGIGLYLLLTNKEFILKEFFIQIGLTLTILMLSYYILFSTTTDLMDTEVHNSRVKEFTYYESWTEEYTETYSCGTSKKPRTCTRTRTRFHPKYYEILTSTNEHIEIPKYSYYEAKKDYGSVFKRVYRSNRVSLGDGNKYVSTPNKNIPVSTKHSYINYVLEAKYNVIHKRILNKLFKEYNITKYKYPKIYKGKYYEPKLKRVMGKKSIMYLDDMNKMSSRISFKECNPILVFTNKDRVFKTTLESYWKGAKKNDIVIIFGLDNNKIKWSDVITYTNNTNFIVDIQNSFRDLDIFKDKKDILLKIENLIITEYKRKPMEEFRYLAENVTLDWYYQLLIVILNVVGSFFLVRMFLRN